MITSMFRGLELVPRWRFVSLLLEASWSELKLIGCRYNFLTELKTEISTESKSGECYSQSLFMYIVAFNMYVIVMYVM